MTRVVPGWYKGLKALPEEEDMDLKGYAFVVLAALMWASSGTLSKLLFNQGVSPLELVQVRVSISALLLLGYLWFRGKGLLRIKRGDLPYFAILGAIGMAMVQAGYFYAISRIQVAAAIFLQYLAPFFVAVYSFTFMHERLTVPKMLSLGLALVGCYLVAGGYDISLLKLNATGILAALFAALCFSLYTLMGEKGMRSYSPWTVLAYAFLFAALTWNVLISPLSFFWEGYDPLEWGIIIYIVIFGTIVPFGLYFKAIELIRSTRAIITATLEPVSAGLMAYLLLGEYMALLQVAGGAMVVGGILLLQVEREADLLSPARLRKGLLEPKSPSERTVDGY